VAPSVESDYSMLMETGGVCYSFMYLIINSFIVLININKLSSFHYQLMNDIFSHNYK
jgi:hypothetical protein